MRALTLTDEEIMRLGSGAAVVLPGHIDADEVRRWADTARQVDHNGALTPAGMGLGGRLRSDQRGDRTTWLDADDPSWAPLMAWFEQCRSSLNEALWLGLRSFTVQVAHYDQGARYTRHRDAVRHGAKRRLTLLLYLNEAWEPAHGGCLRVYTEEGHIDVPPEGGTLVLFLADRCEHEVRPAHAPRLAVTAWFEA